MTHSLPHLLAHEFSMLSVIQSCERIDPGHWALYSSSPSEQSLSPSQSHEFGMHLPSSQVHLPDGHGQFSLSHACSSFSERLMLESCMGY